MVYRLPRVPRCGAVLTRCSMAFCVRRRASEYGCALRVMRPPLGVFRAARASERASEQRLDRYEVEASVGIQRRCTSDASRFLNASLAGPAKCPSLKPAPLHFYTSLVCYLFLLVVVVLLCARLSARRKLKEIEVGRGEMATPLASTPETNTCWIIRSRVEICYATLRTGVGDCVSGEWVVVVFSIYVYIFNSVSLLP